MCQIWKGVSAQWEYVLPDGSGILRPEKTSEGVLRLLGGNKVQRDLNANQASYVMDVCISAKMPIEMARSIHQAYQDCPFYLGVYRV